MNDTNIKEILYELIFHLNGNTYPVFGDLADVDHLRSVIQEAANASQPQQILFVSQLKAQNDFSKHF